MRSYSYFTCALLALILLRNSPALALQKSPAVKATSSNVSRAGRSGTTLPADAGDANLGLNASLSSNESASLRILSPPMSPMIQIHTNMTAPGGEPDYKHPLGAHESDRGDELGAEVPVTISEEEMVGNHALLEEQSIAKHIIAPMSGVFLLTVLIANMLMRFPYSRLLPESAVIVLVAVLLGLGCRRLMEAGVLSLDGFTLMNSAALHLLLLPIIVFQAGWGLALGDFASQFQYILVYAILGTVISTLTIGTGIVTAVKYVGYNLTLREGMVFAALISAVDPVATLACYKKLGLKEKHALLYTLVFGEAMINDAVAIVLFDVFNHSMIAHISVSHIISEAAYLLIGSILLGCLLSGILIGFMRFSTLSGHTLSQVIFMYMSGYFIFSFAEAVGQSGIIANLFAGIMFRQYGVKHFLPKGRVIAAEFLEISGKVADNVVFLLCGTSAGLVQSSSAIVFGVVGVLLCLIARAAAIVVCSALANGMKACQKDPNAITWRHQVMMWHGGLRGGIALVLALEVDGTWCKNKGLLIDGTFINIVVLLLVCGSTTEKVLEFVGLVSPPRDEAEGGTGTSSLASVSEEGEWGDSVPTHTSESLQATSPLPPYFKEFFGFLDGWLQWAIVGDIDRLQQIALKESQIYGDDEFAEEAESLAAEASMAVETMRKPKK
eukprot:TRINITY_DN22685_c0_g4_i1.p1 TRINITY_DN22685_c0_g4~~TRINITY_DN22685_c0_g4_i1.p1  ORF type:complete len:667 (+),score=115.10 TRINITY_DN22685_c0_g4_i1:69-2069(+)